MSRVSRAPTVIESHPPSQSPPEPVPDPDTGTDPADQIYVPPRPGTPFPRGPPPDSDEDQPAERLQSDTQQAEPPRRTGPSSDGSKGGNATTGTTGISGVSVEYTFKDLGSAKKALKRIRVASRRAASSAMMDRRPRSVVGSGVRGNRNAEGYERDHESLEEEESEDDRARRERRRRDNAEVIRSPRGGVKRKEPTHRNVEARTLRPALRMAQTDMDDRSRAIPMDRASMPPRFPYDQPEPGSEYARMAAMLGATHQFKPLPSLPPQHGQMCPTYPYPPHQGDMYGGSFSPIAPSFNSMSSPPMSPMMSPGQQAYAMDYYESRNRDQGRDGSSIFSLRGLREALPFMPRRRSSIYESEEGLQMRPRYDRGYTNASIPNINELLPHPSQVSRPPSDPADNLNLYLKKAIIDKWEKWIDPAEQATYVMERGRWQSRPLWGTGSITSSTGRGGFPQDSSKARTVERLVTCVMSYTSETTGSTERPLRQWMQRKSFFRAIEQSFEKNVPYRPISRDNRWGDQIFAVSAEGFDTVGFGDEAALRAEDAGLLGWVTGCVLKTVTSVLHMLRFNAQNMSFQVLSETVAPSLRDQHGRSHFTRGGVRQKNTTELPDGCGSLVLVDIQIPMYRALIFCIRPPWLIGKQELQQFVEANPEWRRESPEELRSLRGQANLLQASIYDDCVKNHCFFFCITNLQHWVFGHFDPAFEKCSVSPVVSRKADTPSVMEILSVWCLRAVDERPRDAEMAAQQDSAPTPRSPGARSAPLPPPPPPPPFPAGAPPGYSHRDLPPATHRSPSSTIGINEMRGRSMPPSHMDSQHSYPTMSPSGYVAPSYRNNMFMPSSGHYPGIPYSYGYEIPGFQPDIGPPGAHGYARHDSGASPYYNENRRPQDDQAERDRERLRHERNRAHARERRSSWLPKRD